MPLHLTYGLMLLCFTSISASRVVLSLYALDLGAGPGAVGLLFATFFAFPLVLSWPIGIYSDRIGSRGLLLLGALCGACAMVIPYFMRDMTAIYIAGLMVGLAFSFYNVLLQNLVGLLSKPHEHARNFSNSSLIGAVTNFTGPLVAGVAIDFSGNALACLYPGALALAAAVLLAARGGVLPGGSRHAVAARSLRDTLSDKGIVRILVTSGMVQVGQDLYQFYIPVYGHAIGLSGAAIGSVLAAFAGATFVVRFAMPRLVLRLGEDRLLEYSFYCAAGGFLLVPFFESTLALAVVSFLFGLGMGCGQPVTTMMIFSHCAPGRTGETLGLRQTVNNVMRVSSPVAFGLVASAFGLFPVFWISAVMMGGGGWIARPAPGRKG